MRRRSLTESREAAPRLPHCDLLARPLGRHSRALYDTFATTFPSALQTFAPCRLRIWRYHSELERMPLPPSRIAH
jgi:hypothetical protein